MDLNKIKQHADFLKNAHLDSTPNSNKDDLRWAADRILELVVEVEKSGASYQALKVELSKCGDAIVIQSGELAKCKSSLTNYQLGFATQSERVELLECDIEKLTNANKILRDGLDFYANKKNWMLSGSLNNHKRITCGKMKDFGGSLQDYDTEIVRIGAHTSDDNDGLQEQTVAGAIARKTLAEADEVLK